MSDYELKCGDALAVLKTMESESVQCCVTSPPYWNLRDYGHEGQIGIEETPAEYVAKLTDVFNEVRRVLRDDGTLWINIADSYPNKNRAGTPHRLVFALQDSGWWWRDEIVWHKPQTMPENVSDRTTKAHEFIFLFTKNERYYYDAEAIAEPLARQYTGTARDGGLAHRASMKHAGVGNQAQGPNLDLSNRTTRNKRSVWVVTAQPYAGAHFATFPPKLIEPCVLAGSKAGDTILDCFNGSGTTGAVALEHGRNYIGIDVNPAYIDLSVKRLEAVQPRLSFEQVSP